MQVQRVTPMVGVRESVWGGWGRPHCSAVTASAPPRWSLPPHAHHVSSRGPDQVPDSALGGTELGPASEPESVPELDLSRSSTGRECGQKGNSDE